CNEFTYRQIKVLHARRELRGVEVAQVTRIEMFQIGARANECALALRHLFAIDGEEAVDVNLFWQVVSGRLQHSRPEQRVEICNVLANDVVDFAIGGTPAMTELLARTLAPWL